MHVVAEVCRLRNDLDGNDGTNPVPAMTSEFDFHGLSGDCSAATSTAARNRKNTQIHASHSGCCHEEDLLIEGDDASPEVCGDWLLYQGICVTDENRHFGTRLWNNGCPLQGRFDSGSGHKYPLALVCGHWRGHPETPYSPCGRRFIDGIRVGIWNGCGDFSALLP